MSDRFWKFTLALQLWDAGWAEQFIKLLLTAVNRPNETRYEGNWKLESDRDFSLGTVMRAEWQKTGLTAHSAAAMTLPRDPHRRYDHHAHIHCVHLWPWRWIHSHYYYCCYYCYQHNEQRKAFVYLHFLLFGFLVIFFITFDKTKIKFDLISIRKQSVLVILITKHNISFANCLLFSSWHQIDSVHLMLLACITFVLYIFPPLYLILLIILQTSIAKTLSWCKIIRFDWKKKIQTESHVMTSDKLSKVEIQT